MKHFTLRLAAVALFATMWHTHATAENWITGLRDEIYVHQLSIPGTHDSGTGEGFMSSFLDNFARTQDLSIQQQWDSGIRAFDLRPTAVQTAAGERYLKIYHGIAETKIRFDEALRLLCQQVTDNPGEFAIVVLRHETDAEKKDVGNLWEVLMDSCLNAEEFKDYIIPFRHNLTVGAMRGKVLVLSRDMYLGNRRLAGGYISGWSHSADIESQTKATITTSKGTIKTSPLYVQDVYDCTNGKLETKLQAMKTMFQEAGKALSETPVRRTWAINHTSGYTRSASVAGNRETAAAANQTALDYLSTCQAGTPTGIVVMDFAGVDKSGDYQVKSLALTNALIANNKPYLQEGVGIADATADGTDITIADGCVCSSSPVTVYDLHGHQLAPAGTRVKLPLGQGILVVKSATGACRVLTH